jgi:hypothetical protein
MQTKTIKEYTILNISPLDLEQLEPLLFMRVKANPKSVFAKNN